MVLAGSKRKTNKSTIEIQYGRCSGGGAQRRSSNTNLGMGKLREGILKDLLD